MAITNTITILTGGASATVVVKDQAGNTVPGGNISWNPIGGNVQINRASDGISFVFSSATAAQGGSPPGTYPTAANDVAVSPNVAGPVLNVVVQGPVTALQYDQTA